MGSVLAVIGIGYALVVGGLFLVQRNLLYFPADGVPAPAETVVPEMVVVSLTTADGLELDSLYAPADAGRPTIVYYCGNGGHIGMRDAKVRPYLDAGFGVLLVGYRGYGDNPGSPTEEGFYADGRAALGFLRESGVDPRMWVLYGESLGGGVAVQMAFEQTQTGDPVGAVVLEAPFTSVGDVAQAHYPFIPARWLVRDRFDSASKIAPRRVSRLHRPRRKRQDRAGPLRPAAFRGRARAQGDADRERGRAQRSLRFRRARRRDLVSRPSVPGLTQAPV